MSKGKKITVSAAAVIIFAVIVCVAAVAVGSNREAASATVSFVYHYGDVKELAAESDFIGVIKITEDIEIDKKSTPARTVYRAEIVSAVKGEPKEMSFASYGYRGAFGGLNVAEDPLPEEGKEYLIFAKEADGVYYAVNCCSQGRFGFENGKITALTDAAEADVIYKSLENISLNELAELID